MGSFSDLTDVPLDFAASTLSLMSSQVERFVHDWDADGLSGNPPTLAKYLADASGTTAGSRRLLAIELIKIDLEYRWLHCGLRRLVEEYLAEVPELEGRLSVDLLFEEFHIRRQAGDSIELEEYRRRFPDQADELGRLLGQKAQTYTSKAAVADRKYISDLQPGTTLDDFDLLIHLGQGAFASVFLARQRSMQRLVALKVSADRGTEPQTLAQLDHECIVRVYDQRVLPARKLRLLYMQYAAGGTLADVIEWLHPLPAVERSGERLLLTIDLLLDRRGESPPTQSLLREQLLSYSWPEVVCWIGARLARALDYAHRRGVLHRDMKPANVLLTAEGLPKVADFNVSFCSELAGAAPEAFFGGSLAYMSPEQLRACDPRQSLPAENSGAASLDGRSDLYSLGVLLWELLTMARPFPDDIVDRDWTATLTMMIARRKKWVRIEALRPFVLDKTPGLDAVLCRCLTFEREGRYPTGAALADELELCLQPGTQSLLRGNEPWQQWVRRFPVTTISLLMVVPNAVAAMFNLAYNLAEIVGSLQGAQGLFWRVQGVINTIAFPLGVLLGGWYVHSIGRTVKKVRAGQLVEAGELRKQRRRALFLGHFAATISLALWMAAAPAYPIALHVGLGSAPASVYVHFLASLTLCGLIAAAYPFFAVTFVSLRCFYPPLVQLSTIDKDEHRDLTRLLQLSWVYFFFAASVPLLSVSLLVLIGSKIKFALGGMAIGGLAGLALSFWAIRVLQADLDALRPALTLDRGQRRS